MLLGESFSVGQRIAFVTANNGTGGASRAVCRLIRGLALSEDFSRRYSLLAYGEESPAYELIHPKLSSNWFIRSLQLKPSILSSCRAWLTNQWEKRVLLPTTQHQFFRSGTDLDFSGYTSLQSFQIAHLFWCQEYLDLSGVASFKGPILMTLHDMWFLTGGCAYSLRCDGFLSGCYSCPDVQVNARSRIRNQFQLKRKLLDRSDTHIIVTSRWMRKQACLSGISSEKISLIPNYIPDHYCHLSSKVEFRKLLGWGHLDDEITVLYFVGSITDLRKGFDLLIAALKLLPGHYLKRIAVQVLGSTLRRIQQLEQLGVRYKSLGFMADEFSQVVAYNAADFLMCPSFFDNSPNVIAESLCCGLPALALPDTGGAEMLSHGFNGLIPENQSPHALSEMISSICDCEHAFQRHLIASEAKKVFGYSGTCQKHIELYSSLS